MTSKIDFMPKFLIAILVFLMIFAPAQLMSIKISSVAILLMMSMIYLVKNKREIKIHPGVLKWFYLYITASAFFTLISVFYNNPQPLNLFGVNFLYPIIYFVFIVVISNIFYFDYIVRVSIISFVITLVYNIVFVFVINGYIGFIPEYIFFNINQNIGGMELGFIKYSSESISYFLFFIPMIIAAYLINNGEHIKKKYLVLIVLGILSAVFSARTAFIIAILITPFIIMFLSFKTKVELRKRQVFLFIFYLVLFMFVLVVLFRVDFNLLFDKIAGSFSSEIIINKNGIVDSGGSIRLNQFKDLIKTWTYKPLLGWGDAAISINPTRNDMGGIYELSYFALLMQRGLIGAILFLLQIIWIYTKAINLIKSKNEFGKLLFSVLVGFTTFMISNATNPYLYSFDRLLILFFPLMILQVAHVNEHVKNKGLENTSLIR
ncbi:O-antigen ligase family protein [Paenibacillus sp. HW567]|uniref:O-antigen ligase family protein n=1 Tax=Paenibacillus sp. HW567 TaxID=1034769 RepID=UPI00036A9302|nr:oligosaccharide repeat unit polymerase [Paenibacillus sp. HW567]